MEMYMKSPTEYYSTTITMKVTLLFASFILIIYQASGATTCSTNPVTYANGSDCVIAGLKNSAEFATAFGLLICERTKADQGAGNITAYKAASTNFVTAMECFGCKADNLFGNGTTFEKVFKEIGEDSTGVGGTIIKFVDGLNLSPAILNALCKLAKILVSDCVKAALLALASDEPTTMKNLYCAAQTQKAEEASAQFADILKNMTCPLDNQLRTGNTLQNLMGDLGDYFIPYMKQTLLLTQQSLGDLQCERLDSPVIPQII